MRRRCSLDDFRIGIVAGGEKLIGKKVGAGEADFVHAEAEVRRVGFGKRGFGAFRDNASFAVRGNEGKDAVACAKILVDSPMHARLREFADERVPFDTGGGRRGGFMAALLRGGDWSGNGGRCGGCGDVLEEFAPVHGGTTLLKSGANATAYI